MKNLAYILLSVLIVVAIFSGCGNITGYDPVGVLGGSDRGYGNEYTSKLGGSDVPATSSILGTWRADYGAGDYDIISFLSNGNVTWRIYENYSLSYNFSGTFSVSGNQIIMYINGTQLIMTYVINGNNLTLTYQGVSTVYNRVS